MFPQLIWLNKPPLLLLLLTQWIHSRSVSFGSVSSIPAWTSPTPESHWLTLLDEGTRIHR